jgi:hypothetical protein
VKVVRSAAVMIRAVDAGIFAIMLNWWAMTNNPYAPPPTDDPGHLLHLLRRLVSDRADLGPPVGYVGRAGTPLNDSWCDYVINPS